MGRRKKMHATPHEELDLNKGKDDYEIAEDKIFHVVENAEKATLHAIENVEKAAIHAVEDEVDVLFHDLNEKKDSVSEFNDKVKKVKHQVLDDGVEDKTKRHDGPFKDALEEMMWGSLE